MNKMTTKLLPSSLALAALALPASAQTVPNAGQILQEVKPPLTSPRDNVVPEVRMPAGTAVTPPGGAQVTLRSVEITGNTLFDASTLVRALGDISGQNFDLAGLRGLAERITAHYRANGYPFTRSVIPPQDMKDGVLRIQVLEGRYGKVEASSSAPWLSSGGRPYRQPISNNQINKTTNNNR